MLAWLRKALAVEEIEQDWRLRFLLANLLFYFNVSFTLWGERYVEYLSNRGDANFLSYPTFLWSSPPTWLFDVATSRCILHLGTVLAMVGFCMVFWDAFVPLLLLAVLWLIKFTCYSSEFMLLANYDHMHLLMCFVFLISRSRIFFMRACLAVLYILSGLVKLTPSWLEGEYFISIPGRFPLMPQSDEAVVILCQLVILLELAGPLCWYSRYRWLRIFSIVNFVLFHLYSGVVVGFRYTSLMLPVVTALFAGGWEKSFCEGFDRSPRTWPSWLILALALYGGCIPWMISGDSRLTGEGRYFGCFMYDAERRVTFRGELVKGDLRTVITCIRGWQNENNFGAAAWTDTTTQVESYERGELVSSYPLVGPLRLDGVVVFNSTPFQLSNQRQIGDPYMHFCWARRVLQRYHPDRLGVQLFQQLDGHQEKHQVLNIEDFAALNPTYHAFSRNSWILDPTESKAPGNAGRQ